MLKKMDITTKAIIGSYAIAILYACGKYGTRRTFRICREIARKEYNWMQCFCKKFAEAARAVRI